MAVLPTSQHDTGARWEGERTTQHPALFERAFDFPTPGIWLLYSPQLSSHCNPSPETPGARWVTEQRKHFKQSRLWERGGKFEGSRDAALSSFAFGFEEMGHPSVSRLLSLSPRPQSGGVNSMVLHTTFTPIRASTDNTRPAGHKL